MNSDDKKRFVAELLGSVQKSAEQLIVSAEFPDEWDGHELREWLADTFTYERSSAMVDARRRNQRRYRAFKETCARLCHLSLPLVNWPGEPFDKCWRCGGTNTRPHDEDLRECKDCGEHYAVERREIKETTMPVWTPTAERMPPENRWVLVWHKKGRVFRAYSVGTEWRLEGAQRVTLAEVTHWMPEAPCAE